MPLAVALPFTEMSDDGSVWDTGPQYPEMWPEPAEGTSATDVPHGVPDDSTPRTGSPVDIDTPMPDPLPVVPSSTPPAKKDRRPPGWWQRTVLGFPVWMLLTFVAIVLVVFVVILRSGDPGTTDQVQTTDAATTVPSQVIPATTIVPITTPVAAPATTPATAPITATPATEPATIPPTAPATSAPVTQPPATQAPATTAQTVAPATAPPAATLPPDGPVVTIIGRVGPCSFGAECLLAGFALHNFNSQPSEFVCEFSDGSRYTFHFTRQEVERACATGDPNDSITIEVDGVRSATYRHP
jgi:hypothetical protein